MRFWIFQGNPDTFDVDSYLRSNVDICWSVRQKHFKDRLCPGDEVFLWRAAGDQKLLSGAVAQARITGGPVNMADHAPARPFWKTPDGEKVELRVPLRVERLCLSKKETVQREWLKEDPILHDLRILKLATETNYEITANQAERLASLVRNTGRDWSEEESTAGLWAYVHTLGKPVSRKKGSPVAEVALTIGRAVSGVYNKVMNFRSLDPRDARKGLSATAESDRAVWERFFSPDSGELDREALDQAYETLWGSPKPSRGRSSYEDFGEAPDDDPEELQQFAARVRRGQPKFRKNLRAAYGDRCALSGWGPERVLEAVHIVPHSKSGINKLDNGLLMRADLHALFDANLIRIEPETYAVRLEPALRDTPYGQLEGRQIRRRIDGAFPGEEYVLERWAGSE